MKGVRVGDVGTWPTQPLVIVNYGQATAEEVLSFAGSIVERVKKETGIALEFEVNYVSG
jgi:UDP-N-acetylmuramate dehydrogenase